jgi:hypothetical protein
MGLFGKLFGKAATPQPDATESTETKVAQSPQTAPEVSRAARATALDKLSRNVIDDGWRNFLSTLVGSFDVFVRRMQDEGFLTPASPAEKLAKLHTVPHLKGILRGLGGRPSGKKADIIDAIIGMMPESELGRLVGGVELYTVSAAGKAELDSFYAEMGAAHSRAEVASYDLILGGQIEEAIATWRSYRREYDAESATRPEAVASAIPSTVAYMMNESLYSDLSHSAEEKQAIKAGMTLAALTGNVMRGAELALGRTTGTFICPSLEEFLRSPECEGYSASYDVDDPMSRFDLYYHTKSMAALQEETLQGLLANAEVAGVEMLPVEGCAICSKGKLSYSRSELTKMPRLPRHWGCRCTYLPLLI